MSAQRLSQDAAGARPVSVIDAFGYEGVSFMKRLVIAGFALGAMTAGVSPDA